MKSIQNINEFLKEAKVYYLATVEGDLPRVRPYGAYILYEDNLYVMALGHTNATKQLEKNPNAEICALNGLTLRIECKLVEDHRQEVKDAMLEAHPEFKSFAGENGENVVMYRITDATASFYKFMELVDTCKF